MTIDPSKIDIIYPPLIFDNSPDTDLVDASKEAIKGVSPSVTPVSRLSTLTQTYQHGLRERENVEDLITFITNDVDTMTKLERHPTVTFSIPAAREGVDGLRHPVDRYRDLPLYQEMLNKELNPVGFMCIVDSQNTVYTCNSWTLQLTLSHTKARNFEEILTDVKIREKCGQVLKESAEIFVKKTKAVNACVFLMERICILGFLQLLSTHGTLTVTEFLNYDKSNEALFDLISPQMEDMQHIIQSLLFQYGYECTVSYKKLGNDRVTPRTKMDIVIKIPEDIPPQLLENDSWADQVQREANRVECLKLKAQLKQEVEKRNPIDMGIVTRRIQAIEEMLECPITFEMLDNPVTTPQGHTYSRDALESHLRRDQRDPMDRSRLTIEQVSVNRVAVNFIEQFRELKKDLKIDVTD